MALPKRPKVSYEINPVKPGNEYMKYGMDRIEELMMMTDEKTKHLPRTILIEDLDRSVFEYVQTDGLSIILDNKKVPTFYLDNLRYGELTKTWKFSDKDKNVPTPYILVRRLAEKEPGTRLGDRYRIPQPRNFVYTDVPILDEGEVIFLRFKMPQPVNVDLNYEVSLFTKYRVDVNKFDEQVLRNFASRQGYVWIKGTPLPILFESFEEANPIENIDGDKFYVSKYRLKLLGMLRDENEFEIIKATRRPKISYHVSS